MLIQERVEICLDMISARIIILNNVRARAQKDTRSTRLTARDSFPRRSAPSPKRGQNPCLGLGFSILIEKNKILFCRKETWMGEDWKKRTKYRQL
jgi:hypothetical protein